MFKSKIEDAKKASNPVNAAQTYIQDLKKTVHDRIDATKVRRRSHCSPFLLTETGRNSFRQTVSFSGVLG
jgi:hypothetical protein